jgi:hypothetical protein
LQDRHHSADLQCRDHIDFLLAQADPFGYQGMPKKPVHITP